MADHLHYIFLARKELRTCGRQLIFSAYNIRAVSAKMPLLRVSGATQYIHVIYIMQISRSTRKQHLTPQNTQRSSGDIPVSASSGDTRSSKFMKCLLGVLVWAC